MEKTNSESLAYLNAKTEKFNACANKSLPLSWHDLLNQMKIIESEIKEMRDAIELQNPVELIDGYVDSMVTLLGMRDMLANLQFDVCGAESTVADNNDTKFLSSFSDRSVLEYTVHQYQIQGITCRSVYNAQYDCYVFLDQNNKVRKPVGYKPVDLTPFIPKVLFGVPTNATT
jgi:hypothetical protein